MDPGPGVLWVFRWQERPVFLRVTVGGGGCPPCPRLYDDVIAVPVVPNGARRPVGCRARRFVAVADWLSDLVEEGEAKNGDE